MLAQIGGRTALPKDVLKLLDDKWASILAGPTGCANYEEFKKSMTEPQAAQYDASYQAQAKELEVARRLLAMRREELEATLGQSEVLETELVNTEKSFGMKIMAQVVGKWTNTKMHQAIRHWLIQMKAVGKGKTGKHIPMQQKSSLHQIEMSWRR